VSQLLFRDNCMLHCTTYNSVTCRELVVSQSAECPILMNVLEHENGWHVSKPLMCKKCFFLIASWYLELQTFIPNSDYISGITNDNMKIYIYKYFFLIIISISNFSQIWTHSGTISWHWCFGGTCHLHFEGWRSWIHVDKVIRVWVWLYYVDS
jgi:hypothetical protein